MLANDHLDSHGQLPMIVDVTQPAPGYRSWGLANPSNAASAGNVEIAEDGKSLIFTPSENFFGTASFTYTLFDELRGEQEATVTITVENVPDDPEAVNDEFQVEPGSNNIALNVLENDINVDHGNLAPFYPYHAWTADIATINRTVPVANVSTSFTTDLIGLSAIDDVGPVNSIYWPNLSVAPPLKIIAVGATDQGGRVAIDATGQNLLYTPAEGFVGTETFTYTIMTPHGLTDVGAVTVQVGEVTELLVNEITDLNSPATAPKAIGKKELTCRGCVLV